MPSVIRKSVDPSAGHCFTPRPPDQGSSDVWVNVGNGGEAAVRVGHHYPTHCCGDPCHDGNASQGSPTVFVNNFPFHRKGDAISCGDVANNGSPNVFAGSGTGESYMVDNTVPYERYNGTDIETEDHNGPKVAPTGSFKNTPFIFHTTEHDDVETSTEDPSDPPLTSPGSYVVPDPIEDDQTAPPATQPVAYTCANIESLASDFTWQGACDEDPGYGTGPIAGMPPAPTCLPAELPPYYDGVFSPSFQMSSNFNLDDLTINPAVSSYRLNDNMVLTQKEILQNLCFLVGTILDPMKTLYGSFLITSCFRLKSGGSQHNIGQAVDIQFPGFSAQQYWDIAQDIRDNVQYDQMILEYGGINPWFHLSVNPAGHRRNVLTQTAPHTYEPGLIRMA